MVREGRVHRASLHRPSIIASSSEALHDGGTGIDDEVKRGVRDLIGRGVEGIGGAAIHPAGEDVPPHAW